VLQFLAPLPDVVDGLHRQIEMGLGVDPAGDGKTGEFVEERTASPVSGSGSIMLGTNVAGTDAALLVELHAQD
jgi:hypothetical protein